MGRGFLIVVLGLVACGPAPNTEAPAAAAPAALSDADVAAILANDSSFAASANGGDVDGVVAAYAADASILPPNAPAQKGATAIRQFWGGFMDAYTLNFDLGVDATEGRGDLAYVVGRYKLVATPKAKGPPPIAEEGKFVEVLKRQADGSWKYVVDIYNTNQPAK